MTRDLQVWSGNDFTGVFDPSATPVHSQQVRHVVAVPSRAAALRAMREISPGITDGYLRDYWAQTFNAEEVAAATAEPGIVFVVLAPGRPAQKIVRHADAPRTAPRRATR